MHRLIGFTLLLFCVNIAFGQTKISGKSIIELKQESFQKDFHFSTLSPANRLINVKSPTPPPFLMVNSPQVIKMPNAWSYDELGMFCKLDIKLEKAVKMPVKFRLGDLDSVDRKEGNWQYHHWYGIK
ncbi:MAG: hypothetical protein AAFO07_25745 [Bacteroidota bacterium]